MRKEIKRLFIGIPISVKIKTSFQNFDLNQLGIAKIRRTPIENLHVTMLFIGELEIDEITLLNTKVEAYFNEVSSFHLDIDQIELAPARKPTMVWAKYLSNQSFTKTCADLGACLGINLDFKPLPHITLARFKQDGKIKFQKIDQSIEKHSVHVNEVHLYESVLLLQGASYKILATYKLKGA